MKITFLNLKGNERFFPSLAKKKEGILFLERQMPQESAYGQRVLSPPMVSAGQASRQFLKIPASLLPTTSPHFLNLFSS